MKKYIEFKIRKGTLLLFGIAVTLICSVCGYYVWCAYHPTIGISIGKGSHITENLKLDTPVLVVTGKWYADPAAPVLLNVYEFMMQHESMIQFVKDTYKESDIHLEIREENDKTVLIYTGTATTKDDHVIEFDRKITFDFLLHADIS